MRFSPDISNHCLLCYTIKTVKPSYPGKADIRNPHTVYVTEPPHKQFPAGFLQDLQDFLDYIFPIQQTEL